jgi:eukaryotic-like serine/threonine-protein kinase
LTDFGIAKSRLEAELTRPGTTVGSLYYMSPEQARGGSAVDGRADIYSVGINMYELLAGRRPFEDDSAYVILNSQLNVVPLPPIEFNPLLSKPLNDLILKTLEKDPEKRFQSAAAVSDALHEATGIAASTPIERESDVATAPPAVSVGRTLPIVAAAATSRFSIDTHRKSWIAAEVLAILGIAVLTTVELPPLLKNRAIAKTTVHPITQSSPLPEAPRPDLAATVTRQSETLTPDDPSMASNSAPAAVPAIAPAHPRASTTAASSSQHRRSVEPAPLRAKYQPALLPESKAEGDDPAQRITPILSPSAAVEIQKLRDQKVKLEIRAAVVRINVQRVKSQREAAGEGLSQEVATAYVRMNAYLGAERSDLEDGDVTAARDHMDKAAIELNTLEVLFSSAVPTVKQVAAK